MRLTRSRASPPTRRSSTQKFSGLTSPWTRPCRERWRSPRAPCQAEVEERAVGQAPLLDVARERRSRREVEELARVAVDRPAPPEALEHRVPVEDGEALPHELVPAASHLLLDGRLGRDEAPHDERPPREEVRRPGDRVHPSLAERLETFQRKERGAPFLFRRQEGEPARPDDVRPERRAPELGAHPIHDLDPGGRRSGDLLRGATDEAARGLEGPRRAPPRATGRSEAHAASATAPARAETAPFDRGAWHGIVDTSGASATGSLAARRPRFTWSRFTPPRFEPPVRSRVREEAAVGREAEAVDPLDRDVDRREKRAVDRRPELDREVDRHREARSVGRERHLHRSGSSRTDGESSPPPATRRRRSVPSAPVVARSVPSAESAIDATAVWWPAYAPTFTRPFTSTRWTASVPATRSEPPSAVKASEKSRLSRSGSVATSS